MNTKDKTVITVATEINAPIEKVWEIWNNPDDILLWNVASDEWHNLKVENDLRPGGKFLFAMALKDGSLNFDFEGVYDEVKTNGLISYTLGDGRQTTITFTKDSPVKLTEAFDADRSMAIDMQRDFCQAVLISFKKYAESKSS